LDTPPLLGEFVNTTTEPENRAAGSPFPKTKVEVGVKRGGAVKKELRKTNPLMQWLEHDQTCDHLRLLGFCTPFVFRNLKKETKFRKLDLFPSSGEGIGDTLLDHLERANLSH
jgi:hypothetical protein